MCASVLDYIHHAVACKSQLFVKDIKAAQYELKRSNPGDI